MCTAVCTVVHSVWDYIIIIVADVHVGQVLIVYYYC